MKQLLAIVFIFVVLCSTGCKKDSPTGPANTNPAGVAFTIATQPGQNNGVLFVAKPNMDVRVASVIFVLAANHFADTLVNQTPATVFTASTFYELREYTGVQSGQQWTYLFNGAVAANNTPFSVGVSYTIP